MIAKSQTVAASAKAKAEVDAIAALGAGATEAEKAAAGVAASDLIAAPSLTNIFENADKAAGLEGDDSQVRGRRRRRQGASRCSMR